MPTHIRTVCAGVAAVLLLLPAPALAHGGDSSPGVSPSAPADARDMSGHDMEGMEGMDGMDMSGEAGTHDHGSSGSHDHGTTAEDHAGHEQTGDTVSPEMRTLVLTGFGSINGAVVVAAFLIRRQRPPRERGARR
jgi:hypothetical protein